ncbi:Dam family site-specific DNA-(adenine-N6)-methyltransferase [Gibbsiella quercinecans]|uniref:Dam family site-specific DNA-(adenine-N6)-methyltransferase n=1 Tax=Gibbsiella quercinecans TaxID=929813 RepID=UPI00242C352B|nr:Dam family site-specific DNA-(adenine-N6)-methyltransferase [Gibbsiella quercinecans]
MNKTVLKWAGSKARLAPKLREYLPEGDRLVEPFGGSCAMMMNTDYPEYLVADINPDLINLYQVISAAPEQFINFARYYFEHSNSEVQYCDIRLAFNLYTTYPMHRASLFLYLNRHCFNGLCRYNRAGDFNVPYGRYKKPYFPEDEIRAFAEKAKRATFICADFHETLRLVRSGDVVYCDPPYLPEKGKDAFTKYHSGEFGKREHLSLAVNARRIGQSGIPVVISNSIRAAEINLYHGFDVAVIDAPRSIGASGDSAKTAREVLASMTPTETLPLGHSIRVSYPAWCYGEQPA